MSEKICRQLILFFVALLPWSVVISVFGWDKLHLGIFHFWKEIYLFCLFIFFVYQYYRGRIPRTFDRIDIAILAYFVWLIVVSFLHHTSLTGYIYGLRYDAEFFVVFLLLRRLIPACQVSFRDMATTFLISGGIMLTCSLLIRYVFDEMILTIFGFSDQVSVWQNSGPPPIYHGIPGASVIRFQGMLEWPNQMAFFLTIFMGVYLAIMGRLRRYGFLNVAIMSLLIFLMLLTYSRSGYAATALGGFILASLAVREWWKRRKKKTLTPQALIKRIIIGVVALSGIGFVLMFQFWHKVSAIFGRNGSTSGHFERMEIGLLRFREAPLGAGLSQSGPASRAIADVNETTITTPPTDPTLAKILIQLHQKNPDFEFNTETYYIPESWYIQQLVEGGFIGLFLFGLILVLIGLRLRKTPHILAIFLGVLVMNLVLHSFESVHSSFLLFIFIAQAVPTLPRSLWK